MAQSPSTLIFRIRNGMTPYLMKMLKKPLHKKSEDKFRFSQIRDIYSTTQFDVDVFTSDKGNYLSVAINSKEDNKFVSDTLGQLMPFGIWLAKYVTFPSSSGNLVLQHQFDPDSRVSHHLWVVNSPDEFLQQANLSSLMGLDQAVPCSGHRSYYHYVDGKLCFELSLSLGDTDLTWNDINMTLAMSRENSFLEWLYLNGTSFDTLPPRKVLRYIL